ncbi:MAG: hypothetical protein HOO96_17055 [Polyangiaceae bacterium]|nr:hypothetical protein [Polyangiaceae bacterium]
MSALLVALGPIIGLIVGFAALQWVLRGHRKERGPWLGMLEVRAADAANAGGGVGALEGLVTDHGSIAPIVAPFTGRHCLAFHVEIVTREMFGNQTTWERLFDHGDGRFGLAGPDGQVRGEVDFQGAQVFFPTPLTAYNKLSGALPETVFQGPPDQVPAHMVAFVRELTPELQRRIASPGTQLLGGKRLFFNERLIVPGQPVVATGWCDPDPLGVRVVATDQLPVSFAFGTIATQRAALTKLPIGDIVTAVFVALFVGGAATVFLANAIE